MARYMYISIHICRSVFGFKVTASWQELLQPSPILFVLSPYLSTMQYSFFVAFIQCKDLIGTQILENLLQHHNSKGWTCQCHKVAYLNWSLANLNWSLAVESTIRLVANLNWQWQFQFAVARLD